MFLVKMKILQNSQFDLKFLKVITLFLIAKVPGKNPPRNLLQDPKPNPIPNLPLPLPLPLTLHGGHFSREIFS